MKSTEDVIVTDKPVTEATTHLSTESISVIEKNVTDTEILATPAEDSNIEMESNAVQNVQELDVENTVLEDNDSLVTHSLSDSSEINVDDHNASTSRNESFNEDVGSSEVLTITPEGAHKGKFKAPTFPTIAATRTRRIRTPKYMYYEP